MTNREKLMSELRGMSGAALERTLAMGIFDRLTDVLCDDCKANAGGRCPQMRPDGVIPDDAPCPTVEDWFEWACRRKKVLE